MPESTQAHSPLHCESLLSPDEQTIFPYLSDFLTQRRRERFAEVLSHRTRRITVVLDNIYQAHNISAVLRSCDAFGIQDVATIEREFGFEVNRQIALGTDQWLTIRRFTGPRATLDCLDDHHRRGYQLVATTPRPGSLSIHELPLDRPIALFMGNEIDGLDPEILSRADAAVHLPMFGFVESFNLSVATALCLQSLTMRLRRERTDGPLTDTEKERLTFDWTRLSVPNVAGVEARFFRQRQQDCVSPSGLASNGSHHD